MEYKVNRITEVECPARGYALLRYEGDTEVQGEPGQFVMVRGAWGNHPVLPRAFSLVESGDNGAVLVRQVGEGTRLLIDMKPGDKLMVLGPLGHGYTLPDASYQPVLVAGGVGVAPLLFMADRLEAQGVRPMFLYGARSSAELPLMDRISKKCDLIVTTEDGTLGEQGLVTAALKRLLDKSVSVAVFSCGPQRMLEAVAQVCEHFKTPCQVALESPMACGMGTCKGCAVLAADGQYKYVCSDGPVFESSQIWSGAK